MKTLVVAFLAVCLLVSVLCLEPDKPVQKLLSLSKREAGLEQPSDEAVSRKKRHHHNCRCSYVARCLGLGRRRRRRFWRRRRRRRPYWYRRICYKRRPCG